MVWRCTIRCKCKSSVGSNTNAPTNRLSTFISFVLRNVAHGSKPTMYVDSEGSIELVYGMKRMAKKDGIKRESAKLDPLGF